MRTARIALLSAGCVITAGCALSQMTMHDPDGGVGGNGDQGGATSSGTSTGGNQVTLGGTSSQGGGGGTVGVGGTSANSTGLGGTQPTSGGAWSSDHSSASSNAGNTASGASTFAGGTVTSGGAAQGGASTGGAAGTSLTGTMVASGGTMASVGGATTAVGTVSAGGTSATGGAATGGAPSTGGGVATGGTATTGGSAYFGGTTSAARSGGAVSTGGAATGGTAPGTGGAATGGVATGGSAAVGGTSGIGCTGSYETAQSSTGLCVAKMAAITAPSAGQNYNIDVTEVTKGQYDQWLGTQPALPASTDESCGYVTSYAEQGTGTGDAHHPVVYVDWCDAYAYCKGVGKRLCGAIGGGSNAYASYADATLSQWHRACSSGGTYKYPYGNTYQATFCDGADYTSGTDQTVAVGSLTSCVTSATGYAGVYDLSGNVGEWEDSCSSTGRSAFCHSLGGAFSSGDSYLSCGVGGVYNPRGYVSDNIGFRCCSP